LLLICRNWQLRCRAKARASSFETTIMTAKPKFDPERHEENPQWTARDFARARVLPAEVIAQFRNKRVEPEPDHP
jgi:predicted RNA-binding protein with PUA-like domain